MEAGGTVLSAGLGGGINGEGAGLLVCDDLIKDSRDAQSEAFRDNTWEWFLSTAWTRLAPNGVCVMIGTCWHRDDHLARMKSEFGDEVLEINLPAIAESNDQLGRDVGEPLWPEQWDNTFLENQRELLGPYLWNSLYQQRPSQHEAAEWTSEYFQGCDATAWPERFDLSAIMVDASEGRKLGDYGAIVFVGLWRDQVYVDADIARRPIPDLIAAVARMSVSHHPTEVCFEGNQFQKLLVGEYERYCREAGMFPRPVSYLENYKVGKETRIRRLGSWLARKKLLFRRGVGGVELLLSQMRDFPLGDHDDGPDALEMALRKLCELANTIMDHGDDYQQPGGEQYADTYEAAEVYQ